MLRQSSFTDSQILVLINKHNGHGCTIKELFEIAHREMPRYFSYTTETERKKLYHKVKNSINRLEYDRKLIRTELIIEDRERVRRIYIEREVKIEDTSHPPKPTKDEGTYGRLVCKECHTDLSASRTGSRRCVRCQP